MEAQLQIANCQKRIPLRPSQIKKIVRKILKHECVRKCALSIVFVTDRKIKSLNKKYLKKDRPTDVLSFDLRDRKIKGKPKEIVGEIIISADTAVKNSRTFETSPKDELALYLIHGILHLLNFDDYTAKDTKRMRKKEEAILDYLKGFKL